ncbi:MAG: peptidylprolyl isomerase [Parcubacteria group bacterium]
MIEDRVIEKIAKEKGIFISNKLVDESVSRKISEYGGESAIKDNLKNLYGWSLDDFKKKVVRPGLYKEELEKWFAEDEKREENEAAKKMAEESLESLSSGKGFAEVAKEKSLGSNAKSGGYLGWFREEYIADELIPAVSSLEEGKISKVIESRQGYHIVKLEGKKTDEDGAALFGISQIYFPKASFADWISEEIKRVNVNILISGYDWESRTGMAVFSDKEMEKFEERVLKENIEDVSLLSI